MTQNTKHTPGLWRYGLATGSFSHYRVDAGDKTPVIAAVIESEDDARLIAAAPELLEALRDLLGDLPSIQEHETRKGWCCVHCAREYEPSDGKPESCSDDCPGEVARAAIAKATGDA